MSDRLSLSESKHEQPVVTNVVAAQSNYGMHDYTYAHKDSYGEGSGYKEPVQTTYSGYKAPEVSASSYNN